jgi:hypothetical protein
MRTLSCIFLLLAMAMTAAAADVTGKWSGTVVPMGADGKPGESSDSAYLVLKQSGTTLTGTGGADASQQWPIQNGKIVADKITLQVTDPDGTVYSLSMTVNGDHLAGDVSMTRDGESHKAKIELTRVK